MRNPRSVLITGASSGIGEALAHAYARRGCRLALSGRDAGRLAAVASACEGLGARVGACTVDVTQAGPLRAWIESVDEEAPVDLVIANAGISAGTGGDGESEAQVRRILDVNVTGVVNTLAPLAPRMCARGRGQIAIMSSLASFRGFPGAPAYCASKALVRVWGEGLRSELAPAGVEVNVICPGFVVSRMTAVNRFPMPLLMPAARAADIIVRGLERNAGRIAFPWRMYALTRLLAALPVPVSDRLLARLPRKHAVPAGPGGVS